MLTPLEIATGYLARGWNPVPVHYRKKNPIENEWQKLIITESNIATYFNGAKLNVGVQLGPNSNGLTDIDLDCDEAIHLAHHFLPKTPAMFGRKSKPTSHLLYTIDDAPADKAVLKLTDKIGKDAKGVVELRMGSGSKGAQTVFPGSTHDSGEIIEWVRDETPTHSDYATLKLAITKIAVGTILRRNWPGRSGHNAALALGGFLARAGWSPDEIEKFVHAIAPDKKWKDDSSRTAKDSAEAFARGENVQGFPGLQDQFGEEPAKAIAKILGYGTEPFDPNNLYNVVYGDGADNKTADATNPQTPPPARRPRIGCPDRDGPWIPVMNFLNDVLGASTDTKPPSRNVDGYVARARKMIIPQTHASKSSPNDDDNPPPEQWVLSRLDEMELAELIEAHIDFANVKGRSVHLPIPFVKHYQRRDDQKLPTVVAIAMAPIVLADGEVLAPDGLDRLRGIIFEIPKELRAMLPRREDCTEDAIREAMRYLCEEWLCDVKADLTGKATIIAAALTMIECTLLPNRPTFFITAGRRGGGKGTTIEMLTMAVIGVRAAMAAWSTNDEERRKTLMAQFMSGVSYIAWDNIERGSQVSCPHIERASTAMFYNDRKLGVTEIVHAAASAIQFFIGNNIRPRGDLASRSLIIELAVDRPDPENRDFKHPDPIDWTETNRAKILRSLYTILIGNPQLKLPRDAPAQTRFKLWWRLVGSAVEHATKLYVGNDVFNFKELFVRQEETQDEDSVLLADVLDLMKKQWPVDFTSSDVAELINDHEGKLCNPLLSGALRDFFYPSMQPGFKTSAKSVGRLLKSQVDNVVRSGGRILILRSTAQSKVRGSLGYSIEERVEKAADVEVPF